MTLLYRLIRQAPVPRESYPVVPDVDRPEGVQAYEGSEPADDEANRIEKAYQAGYDAGYAACGKAIQAEISTQVKSFTSMVDDLVSQRRRLINESELAVVKISCEVARKIVGKIAELNEQTVLEIVKNALSHLADKQKITIKVNPVDLDVLKRHEDQWLASVGGSGAVDIREDTRIKRGGCLIEGESGSVEAQLDRQIDVVEKALMEAVK